MVGVLATRDEWREYFALSWLLLTLIYSGLPTNQQKDWRQYLWIGRDTSS